MTKALSITKSIIKRLFDTFCSIFLLVLFGWFILLIYMIASVRFRANGLFKQKRIGKDGKSFNIYKIRSLKEITEVKSSTTPKNDLRLTKFGRLIRKTKIDETPQLINVLKGDMSLVGPRPTVKEDYDKMDERQKKRMLVRPGMTGLTQINGNDSLYWPERIEYDLAYIKNYSFLLDIKILLKTFYLIIKNEVETHPANDDEWNEAKQNEH